MQDFFQLNTIPLGIVFYMVCFISITKVYETKTTQLFIKPVIALFFLIIDDNIDYYLFNIHSTSKLHVLTAVLGYNFRLFILLCLVFIALRDYLTKKKYLLVIPLIVNFIITMLPFNTHLVFWYNAITGEIERGPYAYTPHFISLLYVIFLIILGVRCVLLRNNMEGILIIFGCLFNIVCTYVEMAFQLRGILMGSVSIVLVFYYMYLHLEIFKLDGLTRTLNRLAFNADKKNTRHVFVAIIMIDLNNLKKMNDTYGHEEGDLALRTLAYEVGLCLPLSCRMYRIGGDEFCILCTQDCNITQISKIVEKIKNSQQKTKYSWAVGYSLFKTPNEDFDVVFNRADADMYETKVAMKAVRED